MNSWRLNWVFSQVSDLSNLSKHRQLLHSSWMFWMAILLKLVPRLWPFSINLQLRKGGIITVDEFMTLFIYKEIFADGCYDIPISLRPDPIIMDIGANTGLFILRMKQLHPHVRILGYEPMPSNYRRLKRTIEINHLPQCEIFMYGVGGATRKERLYVHPQNLGGHSLYKSVSGGGNDFVEVDIVDIAKELDKLNGRFCDLLKLDCEGAEYEILKRINRDRAKSIEKIIFEPTPSVYDVNELVGHLADIGYQVTRFKGLYLAQYQGESVT